MEMLIGFTLIAYFAPAFIALARSHHQMGAIVVLNFFLGWTVIGWIAALVWSATAVEHPNPPQSS